MLSVFVGMQLSMRYCCAFLSVCSCRRAFVGEPADQHIGNLVLADSAMLTSVHWTLTLNPKLVILSTKLLYKLTIIIIIISNTLKQF